MVTTHGQMQLFGEAEQSASQPITSKVDWVGNQQSVFSCLGASNHSSTAREQLDFYATDPIASEWLIKLEQLNHRIWEPACGQGHLAKVFQAHGYEVTATDLVDRGYGLGGKDFLACETTFDGDIVTNPPYSLAKEFIEHALALVPVGNKVCMFLKVTFLEGKSRKQLFTQNPPPACLGIEFQNTLW